MKLFVHRLFDCFKSLLNQKTIAVLVAACCLSFSHSLFAQGTWSAVTSVAPNPNLGGMLVLSDGTILCKTSAGGGDNIGSVYNRLTPDINGSYANGAWSS